MTAAKFKFKEGSLIVLAIYRIPGYDYNPFINHICECLDDITRKTVNIVVVGDFNINVLEKDSKTKTFIHTMNTYGLRHTITDYTREARQSRTTIDNIFTNIEGSLIQSSVVYSALSDHHAQAAVVKFSTESKRPNMRFTIGRQFTQENIRIFRHCLEKERWTELFEAAEMDDKFNKFYSVLKYHFETCFPLKKKKIKSYRTCMKPQLSDEIYQLRQQLLLLHDTTKDLNALHPLRKQYQSLRQHYKKSIRKAKTNAFLDELEKSDNKTKTIWNAVNEFRNETNVNSNITLTNDDGNSVEDPQIVANSFNSFYSDVGRCFSNAPDLLLTSVNHLKSPQKSLFLYHSNQREIYNEITTLKSQKSSGPDGISTYILKQIKDLISEPLSHIIYYSFDQGVFPEALKLTIVRPLYKKGDRHICDNYRPVSLISSLSKVFERVFLTRLLGFINKNDMLSRRQFGFTRGQNTTDAINSLISSIVENLDKGRPSLGIFFDLTKAFDLVNHSALLNKLQRMGMRGHSHSWISSYLRNRKQVVHIPYTDKEGCCRRAQSSVTVIERGVPQGSVLGPVLFLLFINDLPSQINANICLYADDTSLSISANNREDLEVEAYIQSSYMLQWFEQNQLLANEKKTQIVEFLINNCKRKGALSFLIDEQEIHSSESTKFLGVYIDSNLNFEKHINSICKKLSSSIFALRSLASFMNSHILLTAYYGLIYPFLSYSVEIWGHECTRTSIIFRLQKRAIRTVFKKHNRISCKQIFKENKILTFPCIYIYRVLLYVHKNMELFRCKLPTHRYNLRLHSDLVSKPHKTAFFEKHLLFNGSRLYNALPNTIRNEGGVKAFSRKAKSYLLSHAFYSVEEFVSLA